MIEISICVLFLILTVAMSAVFFIPDPMADRIQKCLQKKILGESYGGGRAKKNALMNSSRTEE